MAPRRRSEPGEVDIQAAAAALEVERSAAAAGQDSAGAAEVAQWEGQEPHGVAAAEAASQHAAQHTAQHSAEEITAQHASQHASGEASAQQLAAKPVAPQATAEPCAAESVPPVQQRSAGFAEAAEPCASWQPMPNRGTLSSGNAKGPDRPASEPEDSADNARAESQCSAAAASQCSA
jgi:hypothetical protein